jgi:hypothetical protein
MNYDYLYVENTFIFTDLLNDEVNLEFNNENDLYLYIYETHIINYDIILGYTDHINDILEYNYYKTLNRCDVCVNNYCELVNILYMLHNEFIQRYLYICESNNIYYNNQIKKINNIKD